MSGATRNAPITLSGQAFVDDKDGIRFVTMRAEYWGVRRPKLGDLKVYWVHDKFGHAYAAYPSRIGPHPLFGWDYYESGCFKAFVFDGQDWRRIKLDDVIPDVHRCTRGLVRKYNFEAVLSILRSLAGRVVTWGHRTVPLCGTDAGST